MPSDPTGTRLVPITAEQKRALGSLEDFWATLVPDSDWRLPHIEAMRQAWDAAPANPAEAVRSVIEPHLPIDVDHPRVVAEAVLAALGCVVERPANTGDHHA